jgi:hypothetical protein
MQVLNGLSATGFNGEDMGGDSEEATLIVMEG